MLDLQDYVAARVALGMAYFETSDRRYLMAALALKREMLRARAEEMEPALLRPQA
jgi:hypothetical protein